MKRKYAQPLFYMSITGVISLLMIPALLAFADANPHQSKERDWVTIYVPVIYGMQENTLPSTPTHTPTPSSSATPTATQPATNTATSTVTATATATATASATATMTPTATMTATPLANNWWDARWSYRLPVNIQAAGVARKDNYADIEINFKAAFQELGVAGELNPDSLRVIEVDAQGEEIVDTAVPFQYDPDPNSPSVGTITIFLRGETAADAQRFYDIYFDRLSETFYPPPGVMNRVSVTDGVEDEGQESLQINAANATYFYHKEGGGFSSLLDTQGNDWISYSLAEGASGEFRGIPNMPNHFHPGKTGIVTQLLHSGPLKITLRSAVVNSEMQETWVVTWEIYPDYATMTVLKTAADFWFLYEGTPGGTLDVSSDFIVRSDGTKTVASLPWINPITNGEWLYFSDPQTQRSIYFVHHEGDDKVDSYWAMNRAMTVFGFGRDGLTAHMNQLPATFTMGLSDQTTYQELQSTINAVYRDLVFQTGAPERYLP